MAAHMQPERVWMPNKSLRRLVMKLKCRILPNRDFTMNVYTETFGRLLFPSRIKLGIALSLAIACAWIAFDFS